MAWSMEKDPRIGALAPPVRARASRVGAPRDSLLIPDASLEDVYSRDTQSGNRQGLDLEKNEELRKSRSSPAAASQV